MLRRRIAGHRFKLRKIAFGWRKKPKTPWEAQLLKSPVSMLVAMLPSSIANQLHAKPDMLESALAKNSCQQRGVQALQFQCKFDLSDGPQSLIVVPEASEKVPKKKAEIQMWAAKCVANCELLESRR
jgi:hypothetical protein